MNAAQIIRDAISAAGLSQKKLATKMGMKSQQGVFNMLNAKRGMRLDNFVRAMNLLGYDVVVKNRVNDSMITVEVESCDTDTDE